jgi:hypothetical protein
MAIDNCCYTFPQLATEVLPGYMRLLEQHIQDPIPMARFAAKGVGPPAIARSLGLKADFPGCYVLVDDGRPFYTGISQTVLRRLRQHVLGTGHNDATLVYMLAAAGSDYSGTRAVRMKDPGFAAIFEEERAHLRRMSAAFVEIENAVECYLFEVYCAMALNTVANTFQTH